MWKILILAVIVHCVLSKSCTNCDSKRSGGKGSSSSFKVKTINTQCSPKFSFGIVWDSETSSALWVDYGVKRASKPCLYRYDSESKKTYKAYVSGDGANLPAPTWIIPVQTSSKSLSKVLVGLGAYPYLLTWDGVSESASIIKKVPVRWEENEIGPLERLGLAHRDPSGKLLYYSYLDTRWCAPAANQSVYIKVNGKDSTRAITPSKVYGGFAFYDNNAYVLESCSNQIKEIVDNNLSGRVVFDFGNTKIFGLEAGSDGTLYTCGYKDGYLYSVDLKAGEAKKLVKLGKGITSLTFGGKNKYGGNDIYVTKATKYLDSKSGKFKRSLKKDVLYKVCSNKKGFTFKRTTVKS